MKRLIMFLLILSVIGFAYELPKYIANPQTGECRYYFAGDERHFNPRPENFTIDIGYVTDFKSVEHACNYWKCKKSHGIFLGDKCKCPLNTKWNNITGCEPIGEGEIITDKELCENTRGIWVAMQCTCIIGSWEEGKGCSVNGKPVEKFNYAYVRYPTLFAILIILFAFVYKMKQKGGTHESKSL